MKKTPLFKQLLQAQNGDELAKVGIFKKFLPCIKGFSKKLNYEEAETDLTIFLLEFINKINLKKFENRSEGEIVIYIHRAFKCKYINTLKQLINKKIETADLETDIMCCDHYAEIEPEYIFYLLIDLTDLQRKIIIGKYENDYTDIEIAELYGVSRQTINKQKKKAIEKIKSKLSLEEVSNNGRTII